MIKTRKQKANLIVLLIIVRLSLGVASLLYLVSLAASYKSVNFNKMTAFECGFSPIGSIQSTFSLHFFIILVIFVIFDLEVVLLLGSVLVSGVGVITFFVVIVFVLGGIYMEWYLGKLKWMV